MAHVLHPRARRRALRLSALALLLVATVHCRTGGGYEGGCDPSDEPGTFPITTTPQRLRLSLGVRVDQGTPQYDTFYVAFDDGQRAAFMKTVAGEVKKVVDPLTLTEWANSVTIDVAPDGNVTREAMLGTVAQRLAALSAGAGPYGLELSDTAANTGAATSGVALSAHGSNEYVWYDNTRESTGTLDLVLVDKTAGTEGPWTVTSDGLTLPIALHATFVSSH